MERWANPPGRGQNKGQTLGGSGKSQGYWLAAEEPFQGPVSLRVTSTHPHIFIPQPSDSTPQCPTGASPRGREGVSAPLSFVAGPCSHQAPHDP